MFKDLLRKIGQKLYDSGLPYMVIGGQAVLLYGTPRLTKDIDITLGVNIDKLKTALKVIEDLGLIVIPDEPEDFVKKTYVLPAKDLRTGIRVDLIFSFTPYEKQAIERAKPVYFDDTAVMFSSVEDLIIHKIFAGRPRDFEDAAAVMLKNPDFDVDYIEKWLKELDHSMDSDEFSNRFGEIRQQVL
jgi:hypothetical protein